MSRSIPRIVVMLLLPLLLKGSAMAQEDKAKEFDLVVYGGTASGVITAVSAAREGMRAAVLEPGSHLGGMVSGGLSRTDYGNQDVVGGMSREYFERTGRHYSEPLTWFPEPHVAEMVFQEMAREAGVEVFYKHRLREKDGVKKTGTQVEEITMENGSRWRAKIFADCTYEGDLMAQAKVSYTWGREASSEYGESLAGVREKTPKHQFTVQVPARDESGKLLPEISPEKLGKPGEGDRKVQAYNFRLCMTQVKENMLPWSKPANYDPARYALLARMLKAMQEKNGQPPRVKELMAPGAIKGNKTDTNNNGAFSTDYIGKNYDYPEADYATRQKIWLDHKDYIAGFMYFLAHDPQVPAQLRDEMTSWGLAADEFKDTGNWPHQLYVREARRMKGEYVMAQSDIQTSRTKSDVIGMGSYNSDSHNVQRIEASDGTAQNEGDMQVAVKPYQIPYRVMLPKRAEATNLLVPVCLSASHVAYSTLRMEPVFMIMGHAAGVATKMAIEKKTSVHDIDAGALTAKLRSQKAVLEWTPAPKPAAKPM